MSLILDALKKARELTNRKPAAPPPAALASFRFGRTSRSKKTKRIALLALIAVAIVSSAVYTANLWMKRLKKPGAVVMQAPQPALPREKVIDIPPVQETVKRTAPSAAAGKPAKEEAILPARTLAVPPPTSSRTVAIRPSPSPQVAPNPGPFVQA